MKMKRSEFIALLLSPFLLPLFKKKDIADITWPPANPVTFLGGTIYDDVKGEEIGELTFDGESTEIDDSYTVKWGVIYRDDRTIVELLPEGCSFKGDMIKKGVFNKGGTFTIT